METEIRELLETLRSQLTDIGNDWPKRELCEPIPTTIERIDRALAKPDAAGTGAPGLFAAALSAEGGARERAAVRARSIRRAVESVRDVVWAVFMANAEDLESLVCCGDYGAKVRFSDITHAKYGAFSQEALLRGTPYEKSRFGAANCLNALGLGLESAARISKERVTLTVVEHGVDAPPTIEVRLVRDYPYKSDEPKTFGAEQAVEAVAEVFRLYARYAHKDQTQ